MTPKKILFLYDVNRMEAVDLVSIIHIDDYDTRFLELILSNEGSPLNVDGCTVTARFVTAHDKYLLRDDVPCEAVANTITIPIDAAAVDNMACDIKIEVNIVDGEKVLTLPFPLWIRVRGSVLDDAQVMPESEGTIPELLKRVREELNRVKVYVDETQLWEAFDFVFSGAQNLFPSFFFARKGGSYALYFNDSDGETHEIFDFANVCSASRIVSGAVGANGHITFTDAGGNSFVTTGESVIGDDYVLTAQDKTDIANIVLQLLPNADVMNF